MAIYHCRFKIHSRGRGAKAGQAAAYRSGSRVTSAVRAAAYRSGGRLTDASGEVHDFSRKSGVVWSGILAPEGAPDWAMDRSALWRAVEKKEDASTRPTTAQLFREAELSIPRELNPLQRRALVMAFVKDQFVAKGMVADIGIHCPKAADGGEQPHVHVMLTMREITPSGFEKKVRDWNSLALLEHWRKQWGVYCNAALEEAGSLERIDHRTLVAQRIEAQERAAAARAAEQPEEAAREAKRAKELDRVPQVPLGLSRRVETVSGHLHDRINRWQAASHHHHLKPLREQIAKRGKSELLEISYAAHRRALRVLRGNPPPKPPKQERGFYDR